MKTIRIFAALAAVLIMSGCAKDEPKVIEPPVISIPQSSSVAESTTAPVETQDTVQSQTKVTTLTENTEPQLTEEAPAVTTTSTTATSVTTSTTAVTTAQEPEEEPDPIDYGAYLLSDAEMEYVERSIFIGDSICKGFGTYNVISFAHVYANGSMGTRNFDEYTFTYGKKNEELHLEELLSRTQPELVFLSMGMNDINMIHPSEYHENYAEIVDRVLAGSDAVVYLCAMTPVDSNFTSNERIDYFNGELQELAGEYSERVYYVDYGKLMLNEKGLLNNQLDGGDGIHLSPYAYRIALWEIYHTLVSDGTLYPKQMDKDPTEEAVSDEALTVEAVSEETQAVETVEETAEISFTEEIGIRVEE